MVQYYLMSLGSYVPSLRIPWAKVFELGSFFIALVVGRYSTTYEYKELSSDWWLCCGGILGGRGIVVSSKVTECDGVGVGRDRV